MIARQDARQHFAREGYVAQPLFAPQVVRAAQADIAAALDATARTLGVTGLPPIPREAPAAWLDRLARAHSALADTLRHRLCAEAHHGPRLTALAADPALRAAAERLAGTPLAPGEGIRRVRASLSAFPEQRHGWHSDVALDDGTDCARVRITAWIPLDDAGPESGGLELAPGTRPAPLPHRRDDGRFVIAPEALAGAPRVRPDCPAGTVLFLDRFTPHRTLPAGPRGRFALVLWMKAA